MKEIEKFIKENKLDFTDTGSSLNGNCVVLAGYALHLNINVFGFLLDALTVTVLSPEAEEELERVFDYAYINSYENFWKTEEAKKLYKF